MRDFCFRQMGVIRTPLDDPSGGPIQPVYARGVSGRVEVSPEFADGLDDIEGFSHIHLVYVFHRTTETRLRVKPYLQDVERGVFATRAPVRPNPIGLSLVRLVRREGDVLHIEDVDVLDGSPLLDIKPYVPRFDVRADARAGWQEDVDDETAERRGRPLDAAGAGERAPGRDRGKRE